jgi:hypothetical protein
MIPLAALGNRDAKRCLSAVAEKHPMSAKKTHFYMLLGIEHGNSVCGCATCHMVGSRGDNSAANSDEGLMHGGDEGDLSPHSNLL